MKRYLLNKKGSSLIMVLGAMLILTAVGVLVITMSSANIRMSSKYNTWTAEYYDLDAAAQERLVQFDSQTLVPAEKMARYYLQNSYFAYETTDDFPMEGEDAIALKNLLAGSGIQELLHDAQEEAADLLTQDETNPDNDPQAAYDEAMEKLATDAFDILYYCGVNKFVSAYASQAMETPLAAAGNPAIFTVWQLMNANWFPNTVTSLSSVLSGITPPQIALTAYEPVTEQLPKQVRVLVMLKSPGYELLPQKRYEPLKVNPLYTNAISASGKITFNGGNTQITGDVVSGNNGLIDNIPEGDASGISSYNGADVTIRGNVYSAGDVHVFGTGGEIHVLGYGSYTNGLKQRLYKNDYYLENSFVTGVNATYTEDGNAAGIVPYLYRDSSGGNLYCNSLVAESGAGNARLTVAGDLWTQDDIQNDAAGAEISIGGNYIGMSSDASASGDPNGSSAVINNAVLLGSSIAIQGDYIIPGTAFYIFEGGKNSRTGITAYYQTAESGSARTLESFAAYLATGSESSTTYFGSSADEAYDLYGSDMSNLEQKVNHYKNYFTSNGFTPVSGINVKDGASYYSLGMVVDADGSIRYESGSSRYHNNYVAYSGVQPLLVSTMNSKTQFYGTPQSGQRSLDDLVNRMFAVSDEGRGFYYLGGTSASITIGSGAGEVSEGIIFCDSNLTINGSGTFTGAIICDGDITITGSVTIVHSEEIILDVLGVSYGSSVISADSGSRIARRFFSPINALTMGDDLGTEQIDTVSSNVGERTVSDAVDRYTINAWRESRVTP